MYWQASVAVQPAYYYSITATAEYESQKLFLHTYYKIFPDDESDDIVNVLLFPHTLRIILDEKIKFAPWR